MSLATLDLTSVSTVGLSGRHARVFGKRESFTLVGCGQVTSRVSPTRVSRTNYTLVELDTVGKSEDRCRGGGRVVSRLTRVSPVSESQETKDGTVHDTVFEKTVGGTTVRW